MNVKDKETLEGYKNKLINIIGATSTKISNISDENPLIKSNHARMIEIQNQLSAIVLEFKDIPASNASCSLNQKNRKAELVELQDTLSKEYQGLHESLQKIASLRKELQNDLAEYKSVLQDIEQRLDSINQIELSMTPITSMRYRVNC